ncbi:hypothetical protein I4U23_001216 [Adineta vaga]|nr:hypothetical protein I4U23_001216 [Adineta vaga]
MKQKAYSTSEYFSFDSTFESSNTINVDNFPVLTERNLFDLLVDVENEMNFHVCIECQKRMSMILGHLFGLWDNYVDESYDSNELNDVETFLTMRMELHLSFSKPKTVNNLMQEIQNVKNDIQHLEDKVINCTDALQYLREKCSVSQTNIDIKRVLMMQDALKQNFLTLEQKIQDIHCTSTNGSFVWKITDVAEKYGTYRFL